MSPFLIDGIRQYRQEINDNVGEQCWRTMLVNNVGEQCWRTMLANISAPASEKKIKAAALITVQTAGPFPIKIACRIH